MINITKDPGPCTHLESLECTVAVFLWTIVSPLLLVIGVSGNILSFLIWSRKRMRESNSSIFLRILAVTDTFVLLIAPLREFIFYVADLDIQEQNDVSCRIHNWLAFSVTSLSAWILSALSIDRLVFVKCPIWAKTHCSKGIALIVGIVLTVCVFVSNSRMLFYLNRKETYFVSPDTNKSMILEVSCQPSSVELMLLWRNIWPGIVLVLYSLGPIVCLITSSFFLIRELSTRNDIRTAITSNKYDLRPLTKMLVVVCLFFIVISLPVCIYLIISPYIFDAASMKDIAKTRLAWAAVALFLYCNNAFNFELYCLSSPVFRKELKSMFLTFRSTVLKKFGRKIGPQTDKSNLQYNSGHKSNNSQIFSVTETHKQRVSYRTETYFI